MLSNWLDIFRMVSIYFDKRSRKWRLMYSYRNKLNKKTEKKWYYLSQKKFPELYYKERDLNKWEFGREVKNKYPDLYISKSDWDKIFNKLKKFDITSDINRSGIFGEAHRLKWDIRDLRDRINELKKKYPKRKYKDYYHLLRSEIDSIKI